MLIVAKVDNGAGFPETDTILFIRLLLQSRRMSIGEPLLVFVAAKDGC